MVCVADYNVVKEGNLYNDTALASYSVTTSGMLGLYDGNFTTKAFTLLAGNTSSLVLQFGEHYSICNLKYYTNPVNLADIEVSYGVDSPSENEAVITSSGTYTFAEIGKPVGFLRVTQSGTSNVDVYQLYVEASEHEHIGFGPSSTSGVNYEFIDNSPIGYFSSDPFEVAVYNEWNVPLDVNVAVAPSIGNKADSYVYIGTTATGVFYGINDNGPKQPAFVRIQTQNESLALSSLATLMTKWDFQTGSATYLETGTDYLRFNVYFPSAGIYRKSSPWNWYNQAFLVNKHEFTANQSFTVSIDMRIVDAPLENMDEAGALHTACKFMLGFTNSYPIQEYSIRTSSINVPTYDTIGQSLAAVWVGPLDGYLGAKDIAVGAAANDNDFDSYEATTNFHCVRSITNDCPIISYIGLKELSENVYSENSYLDGTSNAPWRTLRLSYDHQTQTAYYYLDNIPLSTYQFSNAAFMEACKFFFGFDGIGSVTVDARNFTIELDTVYRVHHEQTYAAAYASADSTNHGPEKMIDKKYGGDNSPNSWLSGYNPSTGAHFEVGFGTPQNIDSVRLRQADYTNMVTISGSSEYPPRYAMKRVFLYFNTGDIRYVDFSDQEYEGLGGWDVSYFTTLSGTVEPIVGATSVSGIVDTLYDRGTVNRTPVFSIDEIQFYTVSGINVTTAHTEVAYSYPWRRGKTRNLFRRGSAAVYELKYTDLYDVSTREDAHELVMGVDYEVSSPVWDKTGNTDLRHYAETLFIRDGRGTGLHIQASMEGRTGYMWRFFDEAVSLRALLLSMASNTTGDSYNSRLDKWKVQYLSYGGNPSDINSWVDIPPITQVYPVAGDFATYTQYMVSNNDGEYYTNFINSMDATGSVDLPSDLLIRKDKFNTKTVLNYFYSPIADIYVEFDKPYRTQGVRVVFADAYKDNSRVEPADGHTVWTFASYSEKASGSYVSPVFDTGTRLNTERIYINVDEFEGDSTILYRANTTPPTYRYDTAYENWEDEGTQFAGLGEGSTFNPFENGVDMTAYGSNIYCIGRSSGKFIVYDTVSKKWTYGESLPTEIEGQTLGPDHRTGNSTVIVGDSLICAATSLGGNGVYSSSMLRYYFTPNEYLYSGWYTYPYQRQPEAVNAVMVSDGSERIFFLSITGDITVFYLSNGELDSEGRATMPLHGVSTREDMIPVYYNGKIYAAGGNSYNGKKMDIYDVDKDVWQSGADMPFLVRHAHSFYYDGYIYVFPYYSDSSFSAYMKYNIESDYWTTITSLGYNYRTSYLSVGAASIGNNPIPKTYCQLGENVYAYSAIREDFRRTKLKKESWESGYLPNKNETVWGSSSGNPWNEVTASGELMPQDRYIQYKVTLESDTSVVVPVIKGATIVQPITVENVPASGTKSIYLKTGISMDAGYESWYNGFDVNGKSSIVYTISDDGFDFYNNLSAIDITTTSGGGGIYSYAYVDAFVIKNDDYYEMWTTNAEIEGYGFRWGNIHRADSYDGYNWSTPVHVLGRNTEGTNDTDGIYGASVVKDLGIYEIWYTGVDVSGTHRILRALSSDGINWYGQTLSHDIGTYSLEPDADEKGAKEPTVIKREGVYHMWYEGIDVYGISRIIYCFSYDGLNWRGHEIALEASNVDSLDVVGVGCPCVILDLDTYHMWFTGYSSSYNIIYYASSVGGVLWSGISGVISKNHEGNYDYSQVNSFNIVTTTEVEQSNNMKHFELKMHNGYTS
jgi:hypothetical protein